MKEKTIAKMKKWDVLNKFKNGTSIRELARITNCDRITIKNYLIQCGCKIKLSPQFDLNKAKQMYLDGYSCREISLALKANEDKIAMYLKSCGINVSNSSSFRFNENVFDKIDTEEKAYWLGFIFADGCVYSNKHTFELSVSNNDIEHLRKFNEFTEYKGDNIKVRTQKHRFLSCRWNIVNTHLWNSLNKLGCVPQKSLILKFPDKLIFENCNLIRHFIRGYWDGDGCITYTDKTKTIQVLGTNDFLKSINEYLLEPLSIYKLSNKNVYELRTSSIKKIYKNLSFLYNNSTIYLQRKYDKYLEYCRLWEESRRLQEGNIGEGCDADTEITSKIA